MPDHAQRSTVDLPSALERGEEITSPMRRGQGAIFLDYDGVLTPIVRRPGEALLSGGMRQILATLAERMPVAVVSGRDLADLKKKVALEGIFYAGSHGFDMEMADGSPVEFREAAPFLPLLDRAEALLRERLSALRGTHVERKRYAVAVHYRETAEGDVPVVDETVEGVLGEAGPLRRTGGKKIIELRPDLDWDKGKAVCFLLDSLFNDRTAALPLYLGDDLTDEDAFRAIKGRGIGIVVRDEPRPTLADYALESTDEVMVFLKGVADALR